MPHAVTVQFDFDTGDLVRWRGYRWQVIARRYTEGAREPFVQYHLAPYQPYVGPRRWARQADLALAARRDEL